MATPEEPRGGARREAGLDKERHDERLRDRLAVEALDREALGAAALDEPDEGRERRPEPILVGFAERDERAAAALDEERRLASEQHDMGSRHPSRAGAGRFGHGSTAP